MLLRRCCCNASDDCSCGLCRIEIANIFSNSFSIDGPYYNPTIARTTPAIPSPTDPKLDLSTIPIMNVYQSVPSFGFNDILSSDIILNKAFVCTNFVAIPGRTEYTNIPFTTWGGPGGTLNVYQRVVREIEYHVTFDCGYTLYYGGNSMADFIAGTEIPNPFYHPIYDPLTSLGYRVDFSVQVYFVQNPTITERVVETISYPYSRTSTDTVLFSADNPGGNYVFVKGTLDSAVNDRAEGILIYSFGSQSINQILTTPRLITDRDCCLSDIDFSGTLVNAKHSYTSINANWGFVPGGGFVTAVFTDTGSTPYFNNYETSLGTNGNINTDGEISTTVEITCV